MTCETSRPHAVDGPWPFIMPRVKSRALNTICTSSAPVSPIGPSRVSSRRKVFQSLSDTIAVAMWLRGNMDATPSSPHRPPSPLLSSLLPPSSLHYPLLFPLLTMPYLHYSLPPPSSTLATTLLPPPSLLPTCTTPSPLPPPVHHFPSVHYFSLSYLLYITGFVQFLRRVFAHVLPPQGLPIAFRHDRFRVVDDVERCQT